MRILVCGSRDWADADEICAALARYGRSVEIIHGGARGADSIAGEIATTLGLPCRVFPADWRTHGKRAGILRNLAMLDERPDLVMAFQRGKSRGTQHTIDEALRRGFSVEVHAA